MTSQTDSQQHEAGAAVEACGLLIFDERGRVDFSTPETDDLFGYSVGKIVGQNVSRLIPDNDIYVSESLNKRHEDNASVTEFGVCGHQLNAHTRSGATFPVFFRVAEFQSGQRRMFIGRVTPVDGAHRIDSALNACGRSRLALQRELRSVNQSSILHELVSGIADQINQPLMAITVYADVTRRISHQSKLSVDLLRDTLDKIAVQAQRISHVVTELRGQRSDFLRGSGTDDFNAALADIQGIAYEEAGAAGCTLEWNIAASLPAVSANRTQIQHVILLLLRNSFESFPPDMRVRPQVRVRVSLEKSSLLQVAIEDNGRGISNEQLQTLYHPFTTTKQNRLGIGLAACKTIIFNHGGRVWHERMTGGGCRVVFTLPVVESGSHK